MTHAVANTVKRAPRHRRDTAETPPRYRRDTAEIRANTPSQARLPLPSASPPLLLSSPLPPHPSASRQSTPCESQRITPHRVDSHRRVAVILISLVVFRNPLTPAGALGSAVAIGGVFLYSLAKARC